MTAQDEYYYMDEDMDDYTPPADTRTASEKIAADVAKAQRTLRDFISRLTARHILEMRGNTLPPGILQRSMDTLQNYIEVDQCGHVPTRIPTTRRATATLTVTMELFQERFNKPFTTLQLEDLGMPGDWMVSEMRIANCWSRSAEVTFLQVTLP